MKKLLTNYLLIGILVLAFFLRVYRLGEVPYGIANDEVNYLYSAYHLWHTGQDMEGHFFPLSFQVDSSLSPVPVYIAAPFVGLLGPSAASGRLPYILMGVGTVFFVYLIAKKLFNREDVALLSALVLAISPWHLLISRGAWDGVVALFFYTVALYIFLRNVEKGNILWSLPFFILGFYSYHATKVFYVALFFVLLGMFSKELSTKKVQIVVFVIVYLGILLSFMQVMSSLKVSRQEALMFKHPGYIMEANETVNFARNASTAPYIIREILDNKIWYFSNKMVDQYLGAYSPQYLFTVGDINIIAGWGTFMKGAFYLIELPLMVAGIIALLLNKRKKEALLLAFILIIAPLPSAVAAGKTYVIRSVMLLPFASIVIALGIMQLVAFFAYNKRYKQAVVGLIILGYGICFGRYLYQYYTQFATSGREYWNASSKELAQIMYSKRNNVSNMYISNPPNIFAIHYGYDNAIEPEKVKDLWHNQWTGSIDNLHFLNTCMNKGVGDPLTFLPAKTLYVAPGDCYATASATIRIADPQEPLRSLWKIYEKN